MPNSLSMGPPRLVEIILLLKSIAIASACTLLAAPLRPTSRRAGVWGNRVSPHPRPRGVGGLRPPFIACLCPWVWYVFTLLLGARASCPHPGPCGRDARAPGVTPYPESEHAQGIPALTPLSTLGIIRCEGSHPARGPARLSRDDGPHLCTTRLILRGASGTFRVILSEAKGPA